jgi:hypothetical protein
MIFRACLCAFLLLSPVTMPAQQSRTDKGSWRAESKTASSITGGIILSEERLMMGFYPVTIAPIRHAEPSEVSSVFDLPAEGNPGGELYRLNIPADRQLLHKNVLCGGEDTTYMLTTVSGKTLQVAFFSGGKLPELKPETVAGSTTLCGTFTYSR